MLNKTILIVDDEDVILRVLLKRLNGKIKTILTAIDGQSAYEIYLNNKLDLIVTDLYLPRITGFQLIHLIRDVRKDTKIPIIVMSAYSSEEIKIDPKHIHKYIQKPFLSFEILDVIMNLLGESNV